MAGAAPVIPVPGLTRPMEPGLIVLNGAPRSGKSSIVSAIQERFPEPWMNLGVDVFARCVTPDRYRPGIGLRPGGERPEVEALVPVFYAAMYESVAAHSRLGLNVAVDVGHHDGYSTPRRTLGDAARRLAGLPAYLVGVHCPIEVIMQRRRAWQPGREGVYATGEPGGSGGSGEPGGTIPEAVRRWQREVHVPGIYDLEVDTSVMAPDEIAEAIERRLRAGPPAAFRTLAT